MAQPARAGTRERLRTVRGQQLGEELPSLPRGDARAEGDYPDSASESLLPECDYVFITGSSFVNKTIPRLLELSRNATTVMIGPSTPASPILFDYGVDVITAFACDQGALLDEALDGNLLGGMYEAGMRVERAKPL